MIFRESAPIAPLVTYAASTMAGVDPMTVLVPFLIAEALGVFLYISEIRYRFRTRGGRR